MFLCALYKYELRVSYIYVLTIGFIAQHFAKHYDAETYYCLSTMNSHFYVQIYLYLYTYPYLFYMAQQHCTNLQQLHSKRTASNICFIIAIYNYIICKCIIFNILLFYKSTTKKFCFKFGAKFLYKFLKCLLISLMEALFATFQITYQLVLLFIFCISANYMIALPLAANKSF